MTDIERAIGNIDQLLHQIDRRTFASDDINKISGEAHAQLHFLAGLLSSDPAIRASLPDAARIIPPRWPLPMG